MKRLLPAVLLLLAPGLAHAAADCRRATTPDARAVCADRQLSILDGLMHQAARQIPARARAKIGGGFDPERRACGANRACILGLYVAALENYRHAGARIATPPWVNGADAPVQPVAGVLPTRIGQCTRTEITKVTPRLDLGHAPQPADFDTGTAVTYANGGTQVSYKKEPALLASRPGDPVQMCLRSIPRGCPAGDARGRFYEVTNPRTQARWSLPDSEHSCGGA